MAKSDEIRKKSEEYKSDSEAGSDSDASVADDEPEIDAAQLQYALMLGNAIPKAEAFDLKASDLNSEWQRFEKEFMDWLKGSGLFKAASRTKVSFLSAQKWYGGRSSVVVSVVNRHLLTCDL